MIKAVIKSIGILLLIFILVSCNQIVDFEEPTVEAETEPEILLDEQLALEAVHNYYTQFMNKRYAIALFHIDYSENPSDTVMDLEALDLLANNISYSVDSFTIEEERVMIRDGKIYIYAHVDLSHDGMNPRRIDERLQITLIGNSYKITNINSTDFFVAQRSFKYELETPR
jgi:hypothetical protein